MTKHAVHFSSASDEWRTPPELFAALNREFAFVLDAASGEDNKLCPANYTADFDALAQNWAQDTARIVRGAPGAAVRLNPPYSRGLQAAFLRKAHEESRRGIVVVCLIPARPDTAIWHKVIFPCASEIRFLSGRVRFVGAEAGAPFPSAVVIFGTLGPLRVRGWNWKTNTFTP